MSFNNRNNGKNLQTQKTQQHEKENKVQCYLLQLKLQWITLINPEIIYKILPSNIK